MPLTRFSYPYSYDTIFLPTVTTNNNLIVSGSSTVNGALTVFGSATFNNASITTLGAGVLTVTGASSLSTLSLSGAIAATNTNPSGRHIHSFNTTTGSEFSIRSHGPNYVETLFGNTVAGKTLLMSTVGDLIVGNNSAGNLIFGTNASERVRIDSSGNVGIGVFPATSLLEVGNNTAAGVTAIKVTNSSIVSNTTKFAGISFNGFDTVSTRKETGSIVVGPSDVNYIASYLSLSTRLADVVAERFRIDGNASINFSAQLMEAATIAAVAANTTVTYDVMTNKNVLYYTTNSTANWTMNVRGSSTVTLNSLMAIGQALTVVFMNTNGATPFRATALQIDGGAVTPRWVNGTAPAAGNANSIDVYTYTIIKTAASTYTVLAAQTRYA